MARIRFTERQTIEALIRTGHVIFCFRTHEIITLDTVKLLEREHPTPLALGGKDDPTNAAYSLSAAHKIQTNGTKATSYGSDKHAISKVRRIVAKTMGKTKLKKKIPARPFGKSKPFQRRKKQNAV